MPTFLIVHVLVKPVLGANTVLSGGYSPTSSACTQSVSAGAELSVASLVGVIACVSVGRAVSEVSGVLVGRGGISVGCACTVKATAVEMAESFSAGGVHAVITRAKHHSRNRVAFVLVSNIHTSFLFIESYRKIIPAMKSARCVPPGALTMHLSRGN